MTDRKNSLAEKVLTALTGRPAFSAEKNPEPRATATSSGFRRKLDPRERRRFRRIEAPVYWRPAGLKFMTKHEESIDVSRGGVRVYSDEELRVGQRLTMELFLKDQPSVTFDAEVAWVERLEGGSPGKFDVGLKFLHLSQENEALLSKVLQ